MMSPFKRIGIERKQNLSTSSKRRSIAPVSLATDRGGGGGGGGNSDQDGDLLPIASIEHARPSSKSLNGPTQTRRGRSARLAAPIMLLNVLLLFSYMPSWLTLARAQSVLSPPALANAAAAQQHQQHQHQLDALAATISSISKQQHMAAAAAATTPASGGQSSSTQSAISASPSASSNNDLTTSATNEYLRSFTSGAFYPNHNYMAPSSSSRSSSSSSAQSVAGGLAASGTSTNPTYASLYPSASSSDALHQLAAGVSSASANHQYPSASSSSSASPANSAGSGGSSSSGSNGATSALFNPNAAYQQAAAAHLINLMLGGGGGASGGTSPAGLGLGYPNPWATAGIYGGQSAASQLPYQALLASANPLAAANSPFTNLGIGQSAWPRQSASSPWASQLSAYYPARSAPSSAAYLAALQSFNLPTYVSSPSSFGASDLSDYVLPRSGSSGGYAASAANPYMSLYSRYGYGGSVGSSGVGAGLDSSATAPYYSSLSLPSSYYSGSSGGSSLYPSAYSSLYGGAASTASSMSPYTSLLGAGSGLDSTYSAATPYASYAGSAGGYGSTGGTGSSLYSSPSTLSSLYSSLYGASAGAYGSGASSGGAHGGGSAGHSYGGHGGTPRITISPLFGSSSNSHYSYLNPYGSSGLGSASGGGGFKSSLLGAGKIGLGLAGLSLLG